MLATPARGRLYVVMPLILISPPLQDDRRRRSADLFLDVVQAEAPVAARDDYSGPIVDSPIPDEDKRPLITPTRATSRIPQRAATRRPYRLIKMRPGSNGGWYGWWQDHPQAGGRNNHPTPGVAVASSSPTARRSRADTGVHLPFQRDKPCPQVVQSGRSRGHVDPTQQLLR